LWGGGGDEEANRETRNATKKQSQLAGVMVEGCGDKALRTIPGSTKRNGAAKDGET